jgi:large conductance mechanosensitive channel
LEAKVDAVEAKATSMLKEFKDFINKGNMLDLAIGVVIGAAFTSLTGAFMNYLINPLVGLCTGGVDFGHQYLIIKHAPADKAALEAAAKSVEEVAKAGGLALGYGAFITAVVNFLVVMVVMFLVVKAYNKMKEKSLAEAPAPEPAPKPEDVALLEEIRDLLKGK